MNTKFIIKAGQILKLSKSSLYACKKINVVNGNAIMTDLDNFLISKTDLCDCIVDFEQLKKTGNETMSVDPAYKPEDMPGIPEIIDRLSIDTGMFSKSFKSYLNFASEDILRGVLQNVNFCNHSAWATDGHKLIIDYSIKSKKPISMKPETILIHDLLLSNSETIKEVNLCNIIHQEYTPEQCKEFAAKKDKICNLIGKLSQNRKYVENNNYRSYESRHLRTQDLNNRINALDLILKKIPSEYAYNGINYKYIEIITDNFRFISKLPEGILPQVEKVIPSKESQISLTFTESQIVQIKNAIDTIRPYTTVKTGLIVFYRNTVFAINRYTDKSVKITLPFNIAPEKYTATKVLGNGFTEDTETEFPAIGFNSEFFSMILSNINSGCIIRYSKSNIGAVYFQCENTPDYLIMPLRILYEDTNTGEDAEGSEQKSIETIISECTELAVKGTKKAKEIKQVIESEYILVSKENFFGICKSELLDIDYSIHFVKKLTDKEYRELSKMGIKAIETVTV